MRTSRSERIASGGVAQATSLFDAARSEAAKEQGMASAAIARAELLDRSRVIARTIASMHGEVNMDMVSMEMERIGLDPNALGPAAGNVFRGDEWVFAGRFVKSARITNHSRLLRVWRLA